MNARRFIVATDIATAEQQDAITSKLTAISTAWWHHFPLMWLVVDPRGKFTVPDLKSALAIVAPDVHMIVIEVGSLSKWSASLGQPDAAKWLTDNWSQ